MMSPVKLLGAEDVAPLSDALPGFNAAPRIVLLAPAGTPAAVVERLSDAVRTVLSGADLIQAAGTQGAVPAYMAPEPLGVDMARESATWAQIIKAQKITAQ